MGDAAVQIHPLTAARWDDLTALFGPNGANSGCWCMWWRLPASRWSENGNAGNRAALEEVVRQRRPSGLLAYAGGAPVGWAALAPRPAYPRLLRSRTLGLAEPDDESVWSASCFFIRRDHRRGGVAGALLDEAVAYAGRQGARVIEGYPVDTGGARRPSGDLFTGAGSTPIMREPATTLKDHPRLRGEHWDWREQPDLNEGSSPPARGALLEIGVAVVVVRIIPACAGSTCRCFPHGPDDPDHPRLRGEHRSHRRPLLHAAGSSPPARGARASDTR
jgi:GNAT superfamily N-acetyltransferase